MKGINMFNDDVSMKQKMTDLAIEKLLVKKLEPPKIAKVKKELNESKVALITSAGVHLKTQEAFDGKNGDPTYRIIPNNIWKEELTITHGHYDQSEADKDINCVFPIERLNELEADNIIGSVATNHYGFMGFIQNLEPLINEYAPEVVKKLVEDSVDIAIFSPA